VSQQLKLHGGVQEHISMRVQSWIFRDLWQLHAVRRKLLLLGRLQAPGLRQQLHLATSKHRPICMLLQERLCWSQQLQLQSLQPWYLLRLGHSEHVSHAHVLTSHGHRYRKLHVHAWLLWRGLRRLPWGNIQANKRQRKLHSVSSGGFLHGGGVCQLQQVYHPVCQGILRDDSMHQYDKSGVLSLFR
jgi:hypothetical protein